MRICKQIPTILVIIGLLIGSLPVLAQDGAEELTETFTSIDGTLGFKYPAGWEASGIYSDMILLVSNPASLDDSISSEEMMAYIIGPQSAAYVFGEKIPADMSEALEMAAVSLFESSDEIPILSEPEDLKLAGYPAMRINATGSGIEEIVMVIDFDSTFVVVIATALPGELGAFEATMLAVLDSLIYTVPEEMIPFTSEDGTLMLEYPAGWFMMGGILALTPEAITFDAAELAPPGSAMIVVYTPEDLADAKDLDAAATQIAADWLGDTERAVLSDPAVMRVGEREGMRVDFKNEVSEGYAVALDFDGSFVVVMVRAAVGELADQEAVVLPILESIMYTAPAE